MQVYTISDLQDIIDSSLIAKRDLVFVVNRETGIPLLDYLEEEYDIYPKEFDEEDLDAEEVYFTLSYYNDDEVSMFYEDAKGIRNSYKQFYLASTTDCFILTDMKNAHKYFDIEDDDIEINIVHGIMADDLEGMEDCSCRNSKEDKCKDIFNSFKSLHDIEIIRIKSNESKLISSMGI